MNKLLAMIAVCVVVAVLMLTPSTLVSALDQCDILEITIFCNSCDVEAVHNGVTYEVTCDQYEYSSVLCMCDDIVGYAVLIDNNSCTLQQLCEILQLSNIVVCDECCMYGYSAMCGDSITIDGYRINVHIVSTAYGYMVGSPILLGSY